MSVTIFAPFSSLRTSFLSICLLFSPFLLLFSARFDGLIRFDPVRLVRSVGLDSVRSVRLGSIRSGSVRFDPTRFDSV